MNAPPPSMRFFMTLSGRYSLSCSVRMYLRSSISWDEKSLYPPRVRLRLIRRLRSRYRILLTERAGNSGLRRSTTSPIVKLSLVALYLSRWRVTFGGVAFVDLSMHTVVLHPVHSHPLDYSA